MKKSTMLLVPMILGVALTSGIELAVAQPATAQEETADDAEPATAQETALDFKLKNIDGEEVDLTKYKGKVVVVVNVASKCGMTPQYKQLQELHAKMAEQGVAVLGFPCNQFGGQEPGSEADIKTFCSKNYGVEFDMFSKVDVNGDEATPMYKYLTEQELQPKGAGAVGWNFEKFILDKTGKPIARFGSRVKPDDEGFVEVIEAALKK
jgi:glutathione peroxidase